MGTEFSAGLTRVKAKTLSEIGSGSRVKSGPGRTTGLRHFPYPGVVGLVTDDFVNLQELDFQDFEQ
jgi:hypothetical protein